MIFPLAHNPAAQAAMVLTAGASDLADGIIARRAGFASWIGGHLDAVADKAFVLTVLVTFALRNQIQWWQLSLLLSRDVTVLTIVTYAALTRRWGSFKQMPSRLPGKLTTAATFLFMLLVALRLEQTDPAETLLFTAAACLSAYAAVDYLARSARVRRVE